jgi:phosphohistidine phosphatase
MTGDDVEAVMIVGHNPGCESLVEILTGSSDGFPTCTVASVRLDGRWADARQGSGQLLSFVRARDLT